MATFADYGIDLPSGAHGDVRVLCPNCSGRRKPNHAREKELVVNVEKQTWFCQHCSWTGGIGAGEPLARRKTYVPPRAINEPAPTLWQSAVKWFQTERGIREDVLVRNKISAATEFCPVCEKEMSHILFPHYRDGIHVNTQHRCVKKHFRQEKDAEQIFYGLDDVTTAKTWIIVEGQIDKLSVEMAGFTNCVSVPSGAIDAKAKNFESKFTFLESASDQVAAADQFILALDEDANGYAMTDELARRLGKERCSRVTFPLGIKDANDCLTQIGPEELRRVLESAEPYPIEGLWFGRDLAGDVRDLYRNGDDRGKESGWTTFDQHYRPRSGLVTVLTGVPSHGKSSWLDQYLIQLAVRHGWSFGMCSPENQPIRRHMASIIAKYIGRPFHEGITRRMDESEMETGLRFVDESFAFILPETPSLDEILNRAKALVLRKGIKGLVIDPWNEVDHTRGGLNEGDYISESLSKIRRFASHYDVHVWLVAHPTKLRKNDDGTEPVPGLYDVSGSAHFRNKADYGLTVWRDLQDSTQPNWVHITKVRFENTGRLGKVAFSYHPAFGGQFKEQH